MHAHTDIHTYIHIHISKKDKERSKLFTFPSYAVRNVFTTGDARQYRPYCGQKCHHLEQLFTANSDNQRKFVCLALG